MHGCASESSVSPVLMEIWADDCWALIIRTESKCYFRLLKKGNA